MKEVKTLHPLLKSTQEGSCWRITLYRTTLSRQSFSIFSGFPTTKSWRQRRHNKKEKQRIEHAKNRNKINELTTDRSHIYMMTKIFWGITPTNTRQLRPACTCPKKILKTGGKACQRMMELWPSVNLADNIVNLADFPGWRKAQRGSLRSDTDTPG